MQVHSRSRYEAAPVQGIIGDFVYIYWISQLLE